MDTFSSLRSTVLLLTSWYKAVKMLTMDSGPRDNTGLQKGHVEDTQCDKFMMILIPASRRDEAAKSRPRSRQGSSYEAETEARQQ